MIVRAQNLGGASRYLERSRFSFLCSADGHVTLVKKPDQQSQSYQNIQADENPQDPFSDCGHTTRHNPEGQAYEDNNKSKDWNRYPACESDDQVAQNDIDDSEWDQRERVPVAPAHYPFTCVPKTCEYEE
ncbi:hypothetical protein [Octadecabacter dasysiphoniae]|uniref:hypothetical protein n=1 Tax=Octadecabacter dasysiphoniae TaxID=2909341 RepID=UPI001F2D130D|nr:hypothetical protein [Octadecabacter dasysiphoniae]